MTDTIPVRFDAKGKYYTKIVSTQTLDVLMRLTTGEVVRGFMHVRPEHRLSDMMNDDYDFLSLTDVVVSMNGQTLYNTSYICIQRHSVQWVIPVQAIGQTDSSDEHDEHDEYEHDLAADADG